MKFIRFGELKAFTQKRPKKCPDADEYAHCPPREKGFFAFPYAFFDDEYIMQHPACEPHSQMVYLRDKNGKKVSNADVWVRPMPKAEADDVADEDEYKEVLEDRAILKKFGLPKQPILREYRPSWVCIMKDPANPPHSMSGGKLDQGFTYLLDSDGDRIPARHFFSRSWRPRDFRIGHPYDACQPDDVRNDIYAYFDYDAPINAEDVLDDLRKRGILVESLFAWPVYACGREVWLTLFKKPHLFEHRGCVWHHLRKFVPARAILAAYGTTWVYTSVRDFERALNHVAPQALSRNKSLRNINAASRFGGPRYGSSPIELNDMFEVFFDEEDIKRIT